MKQGRVPLYYGYNGSHEFWESTCTKILIVRSDKDEEWRILNEWSRCSPNDKLSFKTLRDAVRRAGKLRGLRLYLDRTHVWTKTSRKHNMILLSIK